MAASTPATELQRRMGWSLCLAGLRLTGMRPLHSFEREKLADLRLKHKRLILPFAGLAMLTYILACIVGNQGSIGSINSTYLALLAVGLGIGSIFCLIKTSDLTMALDFGWVYQFAGALPETKLQKAQHRLLSKLSGYAQNLHVECLPNGRLLSVQGQDAISRFLRIKLKTFAPGTSDTDIGERELTPLEIQELRNFHRQIGPLWLGALVIAAMICLSFALHYASQGRVDPVVAFYPTYFFLFIWVGNQRLYHKEVSATAKALKSKRVSVYEGNLVYLADSDVLWSFNGQPAAWRYTYKP